jgi:hypothetical protein
MKIIRDTREKNGWTFPFYEDVEIESVKINSGDYTTEILKNKVVIERKATATELANNLGKKVAKARFYREFDRMEKLEKAYIVCEFSESDVYTFESSIGWKNLKKLTLFVNFQKVMFIPFHKIPVCLKLKCQK